MRGSTEGVLRRVGAAHSFGSGPAEMYGVINWYHGNTSIGNHHDASPLYDAVLYPSSIITLAVEMDGIFVVAPQSTGCVTPENRSLHWLKDRRRGPLSKIAGSAAHNLEFRPVRGSGPGSQW